MSKVHVLVLTGYGTNSHAESAHAARLAGADRVDVVHFADLVAGQVKLEEYHFLIFPGGFLDGDDLGAAQAAAKRWLYLDDASGTPLVESLKTFIGNGNLVLGICNGFQLLVKLGVLPGFGAADEPLRRVGEKPNFVRQVSLSHNDSARYEDRWVQLKTNPQSPCIFTKGFDSLLAMPVRHGEGKVVPRDPAVLERIVNEHLIALYYADPQTGLSTQEYPYNPNGSPLGIAGLTDPTGHILGLMPHPEAFNHPTNHPAWTRKVTTPLGVALFENAVTYLRAQS